MHQRCISAAGSSTRGLTLVLRKELSGEAVICGGAKALPDLEQGGELSYTVLQPYDRDLGRRLHHLRSNPVRHLLVLTLGFMVRV